MVHFSTFNSTQRTGVNLANDPLLSDLVADSDDEMAAVTFGAGYTGISDIETGPDGNLYILTFDRGADGQGSLYRILPAGEGDSYAPVEGTVAPPTSPAPAPAGPQLAEGDEDEEDTEEQNAENGADEGDDDNEENDDTNGEE